VKIIAETEWQRWLHEAGMTESIAVGEMEFSGQSIVKRSWIPSLRAGLPNCMIAALESVSQHGPYYLARRDGGTWYDGRSDALIGNQIIDDIVGLYGVPSDAVGALCFEEKEWKKLSGILLAFFVHGWSTGEDVYIVGEDRDMVLMTSHHGELRGFFPKASRLERFEADMLARGFASTVAQE
jgi:hypothetical protein